mgnify:CR=1 FL=1
MSMRSIEQEDGRMKDNGVIKRGQTANRGEATDVWHSRSENRENRQKTDMDTLEGEEWNEPAGQRQVDD